MNTVYTETFDLTGNNLPCDGRLSLVREGTISRLILTPAPEGEGELVLETNEIKELTLTKLNGCGEICAVTEEGGLRLCRFTLTQLEPLSEFVKAFNSFLERGVWTEPDRSKLYCKTCGTRFFQGTKICPVCSRKLAGANSILKIAKPYLPGFLLAGILILLANVFSLLVPALNRMLIDGYLSPNADRKTVGGISPFGMVLILTGGMLLCHILKRGVTVLASLLRNRKGTQFVDTLRRTVYRKVQDLTLTSASRFTAGGLISRVSGDSHRIADFIQKETVWLAETAVLFLTVSLYFLITRPLLMVFILLPVPLVFFITKKVWSTIHSRYDKQWHLSSKANGLVNDVVKGIRVVKVFGKEEREIEKFKTVNGDLMNLQRKNETLWAILNPILNFIVGAGEFLILYFGARAVLGNSILGDPMTIGELTQTVSYAGYIYAPLRHLTHLPQSLSRFSVSVARMNEVLSEEDELAGGAVTTPIDRGEIVFEDVRFGYNSYEPVLKDLNLTVRPGEMIGLVGRSGAGKSTMINLILRLYDVNAGRITVDGTDLREYDKKTLSESVGVVFQETFLFEGTVYDNLLYAKPEASPEQIFRAAKIACCHEFILKLPEGYNTRIGQNGHTLSGGERQRIALARAILKDPKILILDEATASLDTETEAQIQKALQYLVKDRTTIAIAHRLSTLRHADRIVVLDKGKIAEEGPHAELLKQKGLYYDLVMAQKQTTKMAEIQSNPKS